jgi:Ca2+-dependent lipid-binding protein
MVFRDIECSDLPAGDVEGSSDPYVMFVWDSVDITQGTHNLRKNIQKVFTGQIWPTTNYISKTLNPKWKGKEISLVSNGDSVGSEAMLFVTVMDFDFGFKDDCLGTLALNVKELISMKDGENRKQVAFDRPLQRYGKFAGRIKFVLDITVNVIV